MFRSTQTTQGVARSVCESLMKYTKCEKVVDRYQCGLKKCWICRKFAQLGGHRGFIQPETKKKRKPNSEEEEVSENENDVSAYFDMECRQDERDDNDETTLPTEDNLKDYG